MKKKIHNFKWKYLKEKEAIDTDVATYIYGYVHIFTIGIGNDLRPSHTFRKSAKIRGKNRLHYSHMDRNWADFRHTATSQTVRK